jgi:hypothetical protein
MRYRCLNPRDTHYKKYGGRGIAIDHVWDSFEAFLADMGPRPSPKHTLDRNRQRRPLLKRKLPVGYASRATIQHTANKTQTKRHSANSKVSTRHQPLSERIRVGVSDRPFNHFQNLRGEEVERDYLKRHSGSFDKRKTKIKLKKIPYASLPPTSWTSLRAVPPTILSEARLCRSSTASSRPATTTVKPSSKDGLSIIG